VEEVITEPDPQVSDTSVPEEEVVTEPDLQVYDASVPEEGV
jgi:hypothetical protein